MSTFLVVSFSLTELLSLETRFMTSMLGTYSYMNSAGIYYSPRRKEQGVL